MELPEDAGACIPMLPPTNLLKTMNVVFLVHGTWGKEEAAWYQPGVNSNGFPENLKNALLECGIQENSVSYVAFEWSGLNSHQSRLEGASALAAKLLKLSEEDSEVKFHFVAHSHGGNVVLKALEIYLNERPSEISPRIIDTRNTVELSKKFLEDHAAGKLPFNTLSKESDELLNQLSETLKSIANRNIKRYRVSLYDGSMWDSEKSRLKGILAKLYRHVFTLPQHHQIGGLVTLGTPFYEKRWKLSQLSQHVNKFLHFLSFMPMSLITVYIHSIAGNWLLALTPWVPWVGFNPQNWKTLHLGIFAVLGVVISADFAKSEKLESPVDTNVYFDEATIPYYLRILGNNKICRVLNIHSSYLDEAYWLLAAYPFAAKLLSNHFTRATRPKVWEYAQPSNDVGFWHKSPAAIFHRKNKQFWRILFALAFLALYPIRLIVHFLGSLYAGLILKTKVRALAYGLPADEFRDNSEISIHACLQKPYFETETFDVSQALAMQDVAVDKSEDQFKFLWDATELSNRAAHSTMLKALKTSYGEEQIRQLLALEERAKEYYGVVGIRHSMYYGNETVTRQIAKFLAACIQSGKGDGECTSHIAKIPRRPF